MDVAEMIDELLRVRHPSDLVDTEGDGQAIVDLLRRYGHLDPTEMHRFNQPGTEQRVVTGSMVAPAPIEDIQAVMTDAGGRELKSVEIAPGVTWPDHGMVVIGDPIEVDEQTPADPAVMERALGQLDQRWGWARDQLAERPPKGDDVMDMDIEEIRAKREARIEAEMEALAVDDVPEITDPEFGWPHSTVLPDGVLLVDDAPSLEEDDGRIDYGPQFDEGDEPDPNQPGVGGHRRTELTLLGTTDGMVWAEEFVRIFFGKVVGDEVNVGTMVAWFAPAIETGRNAPVGNMIPEE